MRSIGRPRVLGENGDSQLETVSGNREKAAKVHTDRGSGLPVPRPRPLHFTRQPEDPLETTALHPC
jgi:hypothetical protein